MDEHLSLAYRDWYWDRVRDIVRAVFLGDTGAADAWQREVYAAEVERTQTLFYHADAFHTAADLCKRAGEPITSEEDDRYQVFLDAEEDVAARPAA